jgi:hypothetical protein
MQSHVVPDQGRRPGRPTDSNCGIQRPKNCAVGVILFVVRTKIRPRERMNSVRRGRRLVTGHTNDRETDSPGDGRWLRFIRRQHLQFPAAPGRHGPIFRRLRPPHGTGLRALAGRLRHGYAPVRALGGPIGAAVIHPGDAWSSDRSSDSLPNSNWACFYF